MGLYAKCQFLPTYCMQTFEKVFVTSFFEIGFAIFGPNMANPTLKYAAYKDLEYEHTVHKNIQCLEEARKHEEVRKETNYALSKGSIF